MTDRKTHPLWTKRVVYECDGCGHQSTDITDAKDHSTDCPAIHPPMEVDASELPSPGGEIVLTRNSCTAHLYGTCGHVHQGEPIPIQIDELETAWEVDVDRRGSVERLRWCTDCLDRYRSGEGR